MRNHAFRSPAAALVALTALCGAAPAAAQRSGLDGGGTSSVSNGVGRIAALPRAAMRLATGFNTVGNLHVPAEPRLLGTGAVRAGTTPVSARWTRAATADVDDPALAEIVRRAGSMRRHHQAAFVQAAVNGAAGHGHEHNRWNADSYWATPQETLRGSGGDCEDIAVAKMQALRRLGFAPRDLYLIVGRVPGGQHAALMVRIDNRFWVLDDRRDHMVEAGAFSAFAPVMTFGAGMTWLHGRRVAPAAVPNVTPIATTLVATDGE